MLVVSDTGPIRYLAIIGHVDKLPALYGAVAIPDAVARELAHPNTPEPARALITAPPAWLTVHAVSGVDPRLDILGPGERQAIWLAAQSMRISCYATISWPGELLPSIICR